MKKISFVLFIFSLINTGFSQTVSIINTPGTSPNAVIGQLNYHVSESIYTNSEIGASNFISAASSIDHISFNLDEIGINTTVSNLSIYMKNISSNINTLANGMYSTSGYTLVFSGTYKPTLTGWVDLTLATSFTRSSNTNLEMLIIRTDNILHTNFIFNTATGNTIGTVINQNALSSRRYNSTAAPTGTTTLTATNFRPAIRLIHAYPIDAELKSILNPSVSCYSSLQTVSVVLRNAGKNTIAASSATITLKINGVNTSSFTKMNTLSLAYGAEETILFNGINLNNIGASNDTAYVTLASDYSKINDTLSSEIFTTSVISSFPALEDVESSLPVFSYTTAVVNDQSWEVQSGNYTNPDLSGPLVPHGGNDFFLFDSYDATEGTISRLFSKCLEIPSGGSLGNLTFWMSHDNSFPSDDDSMYVSVSTNGQIWTRLAGLSRYDPSFSLPGWKMETINLSSYTGTTIQLGFEGAGAFGNSIGIDDITITITAALPITLLDFNVKRNGSINNINWSTTNEINTNSFFIQRSIDGHSFTDIGKVSASGNSSSETKYNFSDNSPSKGINYYRLRTVDKDLKSTLSIIKSIENSENALLKIYPNPVENILNVDLNTDKTDKAFITLSDINGKQVYNYQKNIAIGSNIFNMDLKNISSGTYVIKIKLSDNIIVKKIMKK